MKKERTHYGGADKSLTDPWKHAFALRKTGPTLLVLVDFMGGREGGR